MKFLFCFFILIFLSDIFQKLDHYVKEIFGFLDFESRHIRLDKKFQTEFCSLGEN